MTTPSVKSVLSPSKMTTDTSRRRMLKDNSWIKRDPEEDEPVDDDPNFGKAVLRRLKSGDDVDGTPVNSGTSVTSFTKNTTTTNTKSSGTMPTTPTKPPVPSKNTTLKTSPNTSSFTARVFSANTNNKTSSPVKKSFGEKLPEVTVSQTTNRQDKSFSTGPSSPAPLPVTVNNVPPSPVSSVTPATYITVKSPVTTPVSPPPVKSPIRNENVSTVFDSSTSSVTTTKRTVTSTSSSSLILDETRTTKLSEKTPDSFRMSDVSYSSTYTSPSTETLNTRYYTSQSSSAPLENLADTLIPTRSGSVLSQPVQSRYDRDMNESRYDRDMNESRYDRDMKESRYDRDMNESRYDRDMVESRTQMMSQTLYSPTKTTFSEVTSSRSVSSRDFCTVCGKPIAGGPRMILEDLKIFSHTTCFKCSMCHTDLGNLEAGRTIWVHRDRVNCSNCYSKIKSKWYI